MCTEPWSLFEYIALFLAVYPMILFVFGWIAWGIYIDNKILKVLHEDNEWKKIKAEIVNINSKLDRDKSDERI